MFRSLKKRHGSTAKRTNRIKSLNDEEEEEDEQVQSNEAIVVEATTTSESIIKDNTFNTDYNDHDDQPSNSELPSTTTATTATTASKNVLKQRRRQQQQQQQYSKSNLPISFDMDYDNEDVYYNKKNNNNSISTRTIDNVSKKKKRKSSGYVGFGGSRTTINNNDEDEDDDDRNADHRRSSYHDNDNKDDIYDDDNGNENNLYSKDSISKLLQEQKQKQQGIIVNDSTDANNNDDHDVMEPQQLIDLSTIPNTALNDSIMYQNVVYDDNDKIQDDDDFLPLPPPSSKKNRNDTSTFHKEEEGNILYNAILTGDEALAYVENEQQQNHPLSSNQADSTNNTNVHYDHNLYPQSSSTMHHPLKLDTEHDDENEEDWETEVTRRAGLMTDATTITNNNNRTSMMVPNDNSDDDNLMTIDASTTSSSNADSATYIDQLRAQITTTIETMTNQKIDMERQNHRRLQEIESNRDTLQKQELEIQTIGTAYEFYQYWRNEYIIWIGALRELQTKVTSLMESFHQLQHDVSAKQRYNEFYDQDVILVLYEHDTTLTVEQIIGTKENVQRIQDMIQQNQLWDKDNRYEVDEFGRSKVSQTKMRREKRRLRRQKIYEQRRNRNNEDMIEDTTIITLPDSNGTTNYIQGDESDGCISDNEEETYRERHQALQDAIFVAKNDIDDDYLSIYKLVGFFTEWYNKYPADYKSSQASLHLIDLASVLVQLELCSMNDPWDESNGHNEAKWIGTIHLAMDSHLMDIICIERLFDKCIVSTLSDLIDHDGINVLSSRQTRSMHSFIISLQRILPVANPSWTKLLVLIRSYIIQTLQDITIVVLSENNTSSLATNNNASNKKDEYGEALYTCTFGQLRRIRKILHNIFQYWVPILQHDVEFHTKVLQFIAEKFVRLVLSIHTNMNVLQCSNIGTSETATDFFHSIYERLLQTGWLNDGTNIEESTTINAAALIFNMAKNQSK